jgi:hypothetical protein
MILISRMSMKNSFIEVINANIVRDSIQVLNLLHTRRNVIKSQNFVNIVS